MTKEQEIELNSKLYPSYGNNNPSFEEVKNMVDATLGKQVSKIESISYVMPNLRDFKPRRQKLNLSMQDVANCCGCSKDTISRMEKGNDVYYSTVKTIHEFYLSNGA